MSNYLFAFGFTDSIVKIHELFSVELKGPDKEISFHKVDKQHSVLVVAKRPDSLSSSILNLDETDEYLNCGLFFKGQALDHDSASMILGLEGFSKFIVDNEKYLQPTENADFEGTFTLARWKNGCLTIQNDLYSLMSQLVFSTDEIVVSSDSLFLLSIVRKHLGLPCRFNRRVMISKSWNIAGWASAPMINETIIEDVMTLSAGKSIQCIYDENGIQTTKVERMIRDIFESEFTSYKDALVDVAKKMYSSINFAVESFNPVINFGLSGGVDSRVLLALCLKSPKIMERLCINTNVHPSRARDLEIVTALSKRFGFTFNDKELKKSMVKEVDAESITIPNTLGFWILSSLGVYDSFYLDPNYWSNPSVMHMIGVGAEPVKQMMDVGRISWRAKREIPLVRETVIALMSEAVLSMGIEPDSPDAMKYHHMAFKATHHIGRGVARSCMILRPFVQQSVFAISMYEDNPFKGLPAKGPSVLHDLLIILNPDLAVQPFDVEWKDVSFEYVTERLEILGGVLDVEAMPEPAIYGKLQDIRNGPADSFMNAVAHLGWKDERPHKEQLVDIITKYYDSAEDEEYVELYKKCFDTAIEWLNDDKTVIAYGGALASRFLMLELLD